MSLNVYLIIKNPVQKESSGIFIRRDGKTLEITLKEWNEIHPGVEPVRFLDESERYEVYENNITHNLTEMASKAGLYDVLWRPYRLKKEYVETENYDKEMEFESSQTILAHELISDLEKGLKELKNNPKKYQKFNPSNGWGSYEGLLNFTEEYLDACRENPDAIVKTDR